MNKIVSDVNAEISKVEGKLDAQNSAWLKAGKDNPRILGAGADGLGTKGLTQAAHRTAQKLIGRKG
jgi:hypothetical protein